MTAVGSRLNEKVAIITGAAGGIGAALVERFLAEGARVVAADIDVGRAAGATDRLRAERVDVTTQESCRSVVEAVERSWGAIDILVNNAAYTRQRRSRKSATPGQTGSPKTSPSTAAMSVPRSLIFSRKKI